MTDTNATARYAAQRATIDNILDEQKVDGLRAMIEGRPSIRDVFLREIGEAFVDGDEVKAALVRQQLWDFEMTCEIVDRVIEEHERVEASAP